MTLSAHDLTRDSLIWLLASSNFQYPPLLSESFLHLWLFSPDECMVIGLLWIALEKQRGNWNAATVLGVRDKQGIQIIFILKNFLLCKKVV